MNSFRLRPAIKGYVPPEAVCVGENVNGNVIKLECY